MSDATSNSDNAHAKFWWWLKVACGFALIAGAVVNILRLTQRSIPLPAEQVLLAQILVLGGAVLFAWHYWLVKRANANMEQPDRLVTTGGLFGLVRHPMYLADLIYYCGLALFWPSTESALLIVIAAYALIKQSVVEDRWCAELFPAQYDAWAERTRLFIPWLY